MKVYLLDCPNADWNQTNLLYQHFLDTFLSNRMSSANYE